VTNRQRLKHFLTGSEWVRREEKGLANFAQFVRTRNIFAQKDIDLLLDVGANCGQFAAEIRSFYKGEILSFEPVSAAFNQLQQCASGDSNWKCFKLALGSKTETGSIRVAQGTHLSSFFRQAPYCQRFGDEARKVGEEQVPIRRLDEFLHDAVPDLQQRRIYLKIDTQGFDVEVIKGLGELIRNISALQSEVSIVPIYEGMPHWTENIALCEQAGFVIAGMFPVMLDYLRVIEFDCLMVRDEEAAYSDVAGIAALAS
jgi:FkbM family methyltransferase